MNHFNIQGRSISAFALSLFSLCVLAFSCSEKQGAASEISSKDSRLQLDSLFDAYHEYVLGAYPEMATYEGDNRYNHLLTPMSLNDHNQRNSSWVSFRAKALELDSSDWDESALLDRRLFVDMLSDAVRTHELKFHFLPFNQQGGPHLDFAQIISSQPFEHLDDWENYLSRLEAFPQQIDQTMDLLKSGINEQITPPGFVVEQVAQQCRNLIADYEESVFSLPFREMSASKKDELQEHLSDIESRLKAQIEENVNPTYVHLADRIERDYVPMARSTDGIHGIKNGKQWYTFSAAYHTSTDLTPDEIFEIGEREVARIEAEMKKLIVDLGYQENQLEEFIEFLRSDEQFYYSEPENLVKGFRDILDIMDERLPQLFHTLPQTPYDLTVIEEYRAANAPQAYYYPAPDDGSRPGYFYVNTTQLDSRPKYTMTALALHEAVPGHHLQIALAKEMPEQPWFRRNLGTTAFVEGWGLYAEYLGYETGMYDDPYQHFGALTFEMWRACRLVVDVGMHWKGWSREEGVQYMLARTPNSELDVRSEIDRYISWPGQALAYKIGELKIKELRQVAEQRLGDDFDVKEFHHQVLHRGAIPLQLLEENIMEWLDSENPAS
jgi:uncharacterized protein (DUF885 family)